jgi:hypothetical protein
MADSGAVHPWLSTRRSGGRAIDCERPESSLADSLSAVQGFASHPARLGYVLLVILLEVFVVIQFPGAGSNRGEGTQTVRRQRWTVLMMQVLSLSKATAKAALKTSLEVTQHG